MNPHGNTGNTVTRDSRILVLDEIAGTHNTDFSKLALPTLKNSRMRPLTGIIKANVTCHILLATSTFHSTSSSIECIKSTNSPNPLSHILSSHDPQTPSPAAQEPNLHVTDILPPQTCIAGKSQLLQIVSPIKSSTHHPTFSG